MNIRDLINELEEMAQQAGDETEVRLAHQPRWALEYEIASLALVDPSKETCEVCQGSGMEDDQEGEVTCTNCDGTGTYRDDAQAQAEQIVYLAEGNQIGYLPKAASDELGWGN